MKQKTIKNKTVILLAIFTIAFNCISCKKKSVQKIESDTVSSEPEIEINEEEEEAKKEAALAKEMGLIGEKRKPNKAGDIVFLDGSATAYREDLRLSLEQRVNVVAVIFYVGKECSDDESERVLGVGLKHSSYEIIPERVSAANSTELDSVMGNDGRNQLEKISEYMTNHIGLDDTASREYYAPFYFAKEYPGLVDGKFDGTIYEQGWYLPTRTETDTLNKWFHNDENFQAYSLCHGDYFVSGEKSIFWTSTYLFRDYNAPMASYQLSYDFSKQHAVISKTKAYVCAIRDFTNDTNNVVAKKSLSDTLIFPEDEENFYIGEFNYWEWNENYTRYGKVYAWSALPNYLRLDSSSKECEALVINDCQVLKLLDSDDANKELININAGTNLVLLNVSAYGISKNILYPVYKANFYDEKTDEGGFCLVRGIDITGSANVSSANDGNGRTLSLFYQNALNCRYKDGDYAPSKESIDEYLNDWVTYEAAGLNGGYHLNKAGVIDFDGKFYNLDIETDGWLKIEYPLNMKNPAPFVVEKRFNGGMGGGFSATKIYTLELKNETARLEFWCDYGVLDTDGGPTGTAYHYFKKDGLVTYVFQEEYGSVQMNGYDVYTQNPENPYVFSKHDTFSGEPGGNDVIKKSGEYLNPVCRLKMREKADTNSEKIFTLAPGTLVTVLEEGKSVWIDGHYCNWVRVQMVNDDSFVEGYKSENQTTGWVFGGFLE